MGRIGIIDWGIGGIGVFLQIRKRFPHSAVTYFSDTGFTPYGKTSRRELVGRLIQVVRSLEESGVSRIVIGCNAASTAVDAFANDRVEVSGVIEPAIRLAARLRPKRLGLIGGRRTVVSGVYRRGFAAKNIRVEQRIAQPLSGLIESGDTGSELLHSEAKRILAPLANCSHILLACTHYPAITDVLAKYVSATTKFIDPAEAVAASLSVSRTVNDGDDVFLTSGDPKEMRRAAKAAWGVRLKAPKRVRI
ncbi:MAG: glutamate racemase [Acidobacteria bacterium OLB17]|nr:MAG: glutamate racemase [Acidobacteria bacterium OLB17]MCZ2390779.1 aspartate/glutamate racemase family protein [Acidobacteriota bacterium]